jgi:hypothetical protein
MGCLAEDRSGPDVVGRQRRVRLEQPPRPIDVARHARQHEGPRLLLAVHQVLFDRGLELGPARAAVFAGHHELGRRQRHRGIGGLMGPEPFDGLGIALTGSVAKLLRPPAELIEVGTIGQRRHRHAISSPAPSRSASEAQRR